MRTLQRLVAIVPFTAFTACAMPEDDGTWAEDMAVVDDEASQEIDDASLNLVAIAERPGGNQLRFYEPMPGQILTVELGTDLTMPSVDDAVELFRAAAPGADVPAALVEAQRRADLLPEERSADESPSVGRTSLPPGAEIDRAPVGGRAVALAGPCDINTFIANECTDGDQEWCKINWANGFYAYNTTVNFMHNSVCSLTGTVTLTLLINSVPKASYPVVKGGIGRVNWLNISNNFNFNTQVTNASGKSFHVGGSATNW